MKLLEERILKDGKILPGDVLKVDSFLNHQMDPKLMYEMGKEIKRLFEKENYNKIVTIEASGIAVAIMTGLLSDCPVVFAKKNKSSNISDSFYSAEVKSYTHGNTVNIIISKDYLNPGDRVLIVDDFLATGSAMLGLIEIIKKSGAEMVGACSVIEKEYQKGGSLIEQQGIRVESLAKISSMSDTGITFC